MQLTKTDFYYFFSGLHLCFVITAMMLTSKILIFNLSFFNITLPLKITGGLFIIPIAFFIQDIITEVYGYILCQKLLQFTIILYILYVLSIYIFVTKIFSCTINNLDLCNFIMFLLTLLPRHTMSFVFSLFIAGTINNFILGKLKAFFNGKYLATRFIVSTAIGEFIFQSIAIFISWYTILGYSDIILLGLFAYSYKLLFEILATPFNIMLCKYLKNLNY